MWHSSGSISKKLDEGNLVREPTWYQKVNRSYAELVEEYQLINYNNWNMEKLITHHYPLPIRKVRELEEIKTRIQDAYLLLMNLT